MKFAKIVIGANFGDEGKGLMTDYFANVAKSKNMSCLVVCHNGGSQKGHTVCYDAGNGCSIRHIFHHFGSGNFAGADTYLASEYIVNPIIFNREFLELRKKGIVTKCYIHKNCRLTTPFDMMINQIAEECRGAHKHGNCGIGIFETIVRTGRLEGLTISTFSNQSISDSKTWLEDIATNYVPYRLKQLGIEKISEKWMEILSNKNSIIENYINDFRSMSENIVMVDDSIIDDYEYVIFEGAQGLLLDQNNIAYMPHLTPSNTGIKNPFRIIGNRETDMEVCYVSRTYMTRHGAGRFDTECKKEEINSDMEDLTNVPNPYQDAIRYGTLKLDELRDRIEQDLSGKKLKTSLAITHCNEYRVDEMELRRIFRDFKIYVSDGMTFSDVDII